MKHSKIILSTLIILLIIISVVVYFKNNTYKINFYVDNKLVEEKEIRKNNYLTSPEKPEKEGFVFIGWYTDNGEVFDFEKTQINKNINLYAKWATIVTNEKDQ